MPAPHCVQLVLPVDVVYVPAGHVWQVAEEVAPVAVEKVPPLQAVQALAPAPEYVPAPQVAQVAEDVAPVALEKVPAEHSVQALVPPTEYVPAAQVVQPLAPAAE